MEKTKRNHMHLYFDARSINEGFARMAVTAFMTEMNPTLEQLADVKTAVSEAVTNAIVHGYCNENEQVELICDINGAELQIIVLDHGIGIPDIGQAMQPFYTTKPQMERAGMGFAFMDAFMDEMLVESIVGKGTKVTMKKYIEREDEQ